MLLPGLPELFGVIGLNQVQFAKTGRTHRWQAVSLSSGLAKHHHRPVDTVCDKKRVSDSISCPSQIGQSSSSVFEETSSRSREDLTPSGGDRIYAGEACHRNSFFTSSEGRLLQPIISGSEKVRRMETSDRSFQIEPVHPYSSFQNGDYRLSSSCITEERLGHISRLKGCILSHSHPSQVQEVSPLPFYGENLPILSTSVRALPSSQHLHQSSENGSEALSSPGNAFACIPGRLAPTFNLSVPVHSTPGSVTANGFEPGICPELGQIRANSQSYVLCPGCSIRSGEGYDRTFSGQDSEIAKDNTEDVGISFSICLGSSFCTLTDGICGPSPSLWPGSQAFTTMACERPMVSGNPVLGIPYFTGFRQAVEQWLNKDFLHAMVPLVHPQPDFYLFKGASLVVWGTHLGDLSVSGQWSVQWSKEHINVLEL